MVEFLERVLNAYTFWGWLIPLILGVFVGFFFIIPWVRQRPILSIWIMGTTLASIRLLVSAYDPTIDQAKSVAGILSWTLFVGAVYWGKLLLGRTFGEVAMTRLQKEHDVNTYAQIVHDNDDDHTASYVGDEATRRDKND